MDLDVRQCGGIGREVGPQSSHVRQLPGLQSGGKLVGQFALAAALMGEREQIVMTRQAWRSGRRIRSASKVRR